MSTWVKIRFAASDDAVAVAALLVEVFADQRPHFTPAAYAASTPSPDTVLTRIRTARVWVAEDHDAIVGTVTSTPGSPTTMFVRSLVVHPRARGARLAARLLGVLERDAVARGADALELDTTPFQAAAARVYTRFGFEVTRHHSSHGTPMLRMRKELTVVSRDATKPPDGRRAMPTRPSLTPAGVGDRSTGAPGGTWSAGASAASPRRSRHPGQVNLR